MNDSVTQFVSDILLVTEKSEPFPIGSSDLNKFFKDYVNLGDKRCEVNDILLDHKEYQKFIDISLTYNFSALHRFFYSSLNYVYENLIIPLKN